ncbi:hypothetical protein ACQCVO_23230 [Bacillus infantis]|uniref:hypothetical protein n=1 Tax=Bacillus infantis TaxID=324767 RepID=UPI003CF3AC80
MINVKPTKEHMKNIKKHKKFLEKWEMWDYAYYDGHKHYFLVVYNSITGGITGYLILGEMGEEVPYSEAKEPAYYLNRYNTMVHYTINGIVPRMNKNMKPYEDMIELLGKHKADLVQQEPDLNSAIEQIVEYTQKNVQEASYVRDIVYTLGGYQREITRERGYFDREFLKVMEDEYGRYSEIMYTYGLREREMQPDYKRMYRLLESGKVSAPKLRSLLKAAIETNEKELEKSMATFEKDDQGNSLEIDKNNIKGSLSDNKTKLGRKDFEKLIVPFVRNPESGEANEKNLL